MLDDFTKTQMTLWRASDAARVLSKREKDILQKLIGCRFSHRKSLPEVAKEYGVTRERTRQMFEAALSKMSDIIDALDKK